jgi:preprotein translocase subunit SecA
MTITRHDDRVWFSTEIKLQQLREAIVGAHSANRSILVLSHFEDTITKIGWLLREAGIRFERFSVAHSGEVCFARPGSVWVGLVRAFAPPSALAASPPIESRIDVVVSEHHPMQSKDEELIKAASKLNCHVDLCFYFSLDDPLLDHVGSTNLQQLMKRLGMSERECISHSMVDRAIRNAQEKIEKTVPRDVPSHSAEDWFKYNLRR